VRGVEHLDALAVQLEHLADGERHEREHRMLGARQAREVGPDDAVEDVRAQRRQRLGQRVDLDRTARRALAHDAVGEQPDRQDVIEVRMADQDVLDPGQRIERHVADAGAGVDQDVIVEQEGRCPATCGDGAGATEYLDDHALPG
jgi:hypothetical protein